jgi:hypothetical protein
MGIMKRGASGNSKLRKESLTELCSTYHIDDFTAEWISSVSTC